MNGLWAVAGPIAVWPLVRAVAIIRGLLARSGAAQDQDGSR